MESSRSTQAASGDPNPRPQQRSELLLVPKASSYWLCLFTTVLLLAMTPLVSTATTYDVTNFGDTFRQPILPSMLETL